MSAVTAFLSVTLLILSANGQGSCPVGFEAYSDWCYILLTAQSAWAEAQQYCQIVGGSLAVIQDSAEQSFVEGMLTRIQGTIATGQIWIGGTDLLQEGIFVEPNTLEPLAYFNWGPGEPDNLSGQHCLAMFKGSWLWDDNKCEVNNYPLCKRAAGSNEVVIG